MGRRPLLWKAFLFLTIGSDFYWFYCISIVLFENCIFHIIYKFVFYKLYWPYICNWICIKQTWEWVYWRKLKIKQINEVPSEYWIPTFLLSRKAILELSKCPVFLLMPWKCLQLIIEQFYSTPLVGVKSRKVFLWISNQWTAWISQFHKLRKKIVNLHNSVVHEMPWKTWEIPDQMQWHKETPRMHFIYRVGSYFDNHLGRVTKCKSYRTNTAVCFSWCGHQNRFGLKLTNPTDAKIFESEREATQSAWSHVQLEPTIHSKLCCPKTLEYNN